MFHLCPQLAATTLPWIGASFTAKGTGLPNLAAVFAVTGTSAIATGQLPIASLLPEGQPGCDLLVQPVLVELLLTTNGGAISQTDLPDNPALIGAMLYHQMVPFELDAQLAIAAITATNSLQLVIGHF